MVVVCLIVAIGSSIFQPDEDIFRVFENLGESLKTERFPFVLGDFASAEGVELVRILSHFLFHA